MLLSSKNITRFFALAAFALFAPHIHAQSTLSQNQDGFDGQTMDGYMNIEPGKDSTVVERTVSKDYYQWIIDCNTGLPVIIQPDTVYEAFKGTSPSGLVTVSRIPIRRPNTSMISEDTVVM